MQSSIPKINLRNSASYWFLLQEYIMMHSPLNVTLLPIKQQEDLESTGFAT